MIPARSIFTSTTIIGLVCLFFFLPYTQADREETNHNSSGDKSIGRDASSSDSKEKIYILPVQGQITTPTFYILRRGLKQAEENGISHVIIDMDTPGGALGATLEIMEALSNFNGEVYTYINREAISAGAYISIATDRIYFHPGGIIGAAEAVAGGGQDIPEGMQRKINSYIQAKVRSLTEEYRYRSDVMRAMSDPNFVLEIDDEVLKKEGELLSLTAREAVKEYGEPPQPLLGAGIYDSMDDLLESLFGADGYEVKSFEVTWSESLAHYLNVIAPLLLGAGMLLLFIEFKTPGFGIFGILGVSLLALVFISSHLAGLAGYEAIIVFFLGIILILVEIFILPGLILPALLGIALIIGALIWSMADIWPNQPIEIGLFTGPILNFILGMFIAMVGAIFLARFLPRTWIWNKLVLQTSLANATAMGDSTPVKSGDALGSIPNTPHGWPDIGTEGITRTTLFPNGQVEINGKRYEAKTLIGQIEINTRVRVTGFQDFGLTVEAID